MKKLIRVTKTATLTGHKDCIYTLERSDKENVFFSAAGDGMVIAWNFDDPSTGNVIMQTKASVYALCYFEKLNYLLVGQNFAGIHVIDLAEKKEIKFIELTSSEIFDIKAIGNVICVCTGEGKVILLSQDDFSIIKELKFSDKSARSVSFHPQKNEFSVGYSDHLIRIFDMI